MGTKIVVKINTIEKVNRFTNVTMLFKSNVDVSRGKYTVDGKSVLGILTMDLREPFDVILHSEDEEEIRNFNNAMEEFKWGK